MDNYPYIIAGLPDLIIDFEHHNFDYERLREGIFENSSQEDRRLIEWLEFGFNEKNLSPHFYRACKTCKNKFISEFFKFDRFLRSEKVAFLSGEPTSDDFEEKEKITEIFDITNIIEREKAIDKLIWDKINEITTFDFFNLNVILAFLAKSHIVSRWNRLDKATGENLFKKLITEVRGTFGGVEFENLKK